MLKIAVFGSAFNPPSLGHKSVIDSLSHFDKVLLVPSIAHAWGKEMLDYQIRCQLVDQFISDIGRQNIERSRVEESLHQKGGAVTTFSVLSSLQQQNPNAELTFVLGPDNLFNFAKFAHSDEIVKRWSILACPEKITVRSTEIRETLIKGLNVDHLTTDGVAQQLQRLGLYL
ncbi:nicotinate-nicotinamide nucleotide adenylyltransferase [Vibrio hippocampi]|uniref:nicotinate-nucleotide adenylyltransferase n=1 Tax=Vibrio hippocampi TaxID=654686 RepID=A0ABN8DPP2_9VIBR|nr:nicotinate-nicotinamide nucleotide adenylyltransferase [Vibrio hippocampi]CAH0530053.1 Nicotinate-nucleotide adenylyltransferase [Vibrio hippocampi]